MRPLVILLLVLCLLVSSVPVAAEQPMPAHLVQLARALGVPADVTLVFVHSNSAHEWNGMFQQAGCWWGVICLDASIYIVAGDAANPQTLRYVLAHEIGHYWQSRSSASYPSTKAFEQYADVWGVNALCALGEPGLEYMEQAFASLWRVEHNDLRTDTSHGSAMERLAHARVHATRCTQREAP